MWQFQQPLEQLYAQTFLFASQASAASSLEQSPSEELISFSASRENHRILWKPLVTCRSQNDPPPAFVSEQIYLVYVP
jgi:hypothetical protein